MCPACLASIGWVLAQAASAGAADSPVARMHAVAGSATHRTAIDRTPRGRAKGKVVVKVQVTLSDDAVPYHPLARYGLRLFRSPTDSVVLRRRPENR